MDERHDAQTTFQRAETARIEGDLVHAVELYRRVAELEPAHPKARARLGGLLEYSASRLVDADLDRALDIYHEAWQIDPTREKLRVRYGRALRRKLSDVLLADDRPTALDLVARGPLAGSEVGTLAHAMPIEPLRRVLDASEADRWLVLLDNRIDVDILPAILRGLPRADIHTLSTPASRDFGRLSQPVSAIDRAEPVGFRDEARLFRESERATTRVLEALRGSLPHTLVSSAGIDVLDHLSFAVDDVVFRAAKELFVLRQILATRNHDLVLLVTGEGMVREAVDAIGAVAPLEMPVWELRCAADPYAYDPEPRRLDRSATVAVKDHGTTELPASRPDPPRPRRRSLLRRIFERKTASVRCALLATPNLIHISNVVTVGERLDPSVEVIAVPLSGEPKRAQTQAPYEELVGRRPNTQLTQACAVNLASSEQASDLVRRAFDASADALAACEVGGMRVGPSARPALERLLSRRLPFLSELALRIDGFIADERPDALVVSPDRAPELRIACTVARSRGVPTVFPQMAFFSRSPRYKPLQADRICVLDEDHRRLFVEHFGAAPEQVVVTGIPRFDPIIARRERGLPSPPGDGSVLLVLQSLATTYNEMFAGRLVDAVRPSGRLRIKLHPRDTETSFHALSALVADRLPDRASVHWKEDVHDLVAVSDVVVSTFSNVVLEAAMLDRPVICANLTGEPLPVPFVEQGVALGADSEAELERVVTRAIGDAAFRDEIRARSSTYFSENPHLLQGRAADRVVALVESLARNPRAS